MERRRPRLDPMVAEQISDRLALVLAERPPRRAQLADVGVAPPDSQPLALVSPSLGAQRDRPAADDRPGRDHGAAPVLVSADSHDDDAELHRLDELPPVRRFSRLHLAVLAGLVVLGLLFAGWSLFRARPVAIATPGSVVTSPSAPTTPRAGTIPAPASPKPTVVVHILGAVRRPGLVTLAEPARVQDAIDAAGGLKSGGKPGDLNLAQQLSDGQQVVISRSSDPPSEVRDGGSPGASGGSAQSGGGAASAILDLNRATSAQLEALPGVGPVTAAKIIAWREGHSRFSRVEELQEVDGIGPKIYAQIAPHVRV